MLAAAQEAIAVAEGMAEQDLQANRMIARAPARQIEIAGEAATKVSGDVRSRSPGIPWADIPGMRNRTIHAYFDVNLRIILNTVLEDFPPLVEGLTELLATSGEGE